jgi:hypothetical protein
MGGREKIFIEKILGIAYDFARLRRSPEKGGDIHG